MLVLLTYMLGTAILIPGEVSIYRIKSPRSPCSSCFCHVEAVPPTCCLLFFFLEVWTLSILNAVWRGDPGCSSVSYSVPGFYWVSAGIWCWVCSRRASGRGVDYCFVYCICRTCLVPVRYPGAFCAVLVVSVVRLLARPDGVD